MVFREGRFGYLIFVDEVMLFGMGWIVLCDGIFISMFTGIDIEVIRVIFEI
jgi:hypothetical protein